MQEFPAPLIISGPPRSGTTLLYNLFDHHPQVLWLTKEAYLFEHIYDIGDDLDVYLDTFQWPLDVVLEGIRQKDTLPALHTPYEQGSEHGLVHPVRIEIPWSEQAFRGVLEQAEFADVRSLWNATIQALAAGLDLSNELPVYRFACLKAPDYGKSAFAAIDHIEEARAIIVVRNPVAALESLKRSRNIADRKKLVAPIFSQAVRDMKLLARKIGEADTTKIYCARYEDVVTNPAKFMREIAAWLNIRYDPSLERPTVFGAPWGGDSAFDELKGIDTRPINRPIKHLTGYEIEHINSHLGAFYTQFGYEPPSAVLSSGEGATAAE